MRVVYKEDIEAMTAAQNSTIYLKDYQAPAFSVISLELDFDLAATKTQVQSRMRLQRNADAKQNHDLVLPGEELTLLAVTVNNNPLTAEQYKVDEHTLVIFNVPDEFDLAITTEINPQANMTLSGLYLSNNIFCTQCESEGFRRITYFLDRPDVMTKFTTKITAPKQQYPILLANGNMIDSGELDNERHYAIWEDPFKKPCYLFALVAGDLDYLEDKFVTCSGRDVVLKIFVEKGKVEKTKHAMECLKASMRWDEETYGREYDLDIFMIVAVHDFNFGAMENKGLNIFNDKYILVEANTATDQDFENVLTVVGHEYFHNWSGNRVTLRDWFQLSLKEGFTVFRDQSFTAAMTSATVARINDVNGLRTQQFTEDAGPMSHPVRPEAFIEISNFYTATVYNKGAEVVRMLHTILGAEAFRRGTDLYFKRHDGQAVTCEHFVAALEDANKIDLSQFMLWYRQAGTPELQVTADYDVNEREYHLTIKQSLPETPKQTSKEPMHIPVNVALYNKEGQEIHRSQTLNFTKAEQKFTIADVQEKPIPSLLRHFSAPVKLQFDYTEKELALLLAHDSDGFNRWEAGQKLAAKTILQLVADHQQNKTLSLSENLIVAFRTVIADQTIDSFLKTKLLCLPNEKYLAELMTVVDVDAIHAARNFVHEQLAKQLQQEFFQLYNLNRSSIDYIYNVAESGRRSLQNLCLHYLRFLAEDDEMRQLIVAQFNNANNMTDKLAALSVLAHLEHADRDVALKQFYDQWQHDSLVIDKWFSLQAMSDRKDTLKNVIALTQHPSFDIKNPNKVYALILGLSNYNPVHFHESNGEGYKFLAEKTLAIDAFNPHVSSRVIIPLTQWRRYDENRQKLMYAQLQRIANEDKLSKHIYEVVHKSL